MTILQEPIETTYHYEQEVFGKKSAATVTLSIQNTRNMSAVIKNGEYLKICEAGGNKISVSQAFVDKYAGSKDSWYEYRSALISGANSSFARGCYFGLPVVGLSITINSFQSVGNATTPAAVRTAVQKAVYKLLKDINAPKMLEPIMDVTLTCPSRYVGLVTKDLTNVRQGVVDSMETSDDVFSKSTLTGFVPLREMIGYSSHHKSISQGSGSFNIKLKGFGELSGSKRDKVLQELRGY